jgi:Reverse transcriptase (RNA-dependent DNA polymerase)
MGISQSPDISQEAMEDLLQLFEEADVYIDDIGVFSNSWSDHLLSLSKIMNLLERNNFTINHLKCEWGVKETDWLGYWLAPTRLKPWK